jgi:hypothetical protein
MRTRMWGAVGTGRENPLVTRLAGSRTDRPQKRLTDRLLGAFSMTDHSFVATALTDNLLDAFAPTNKTKTTASTDNFLGAFGLTDTLEAQVQRLDAEPANARHQWRRLAPSADAVVGRQPNRTW